MNMIDCNSRLLQTLAFTLLFVQYYSWAVAYKLLNKTFFETPLEKCGNTYARRHAHSKALKSITNAILWTFCFDRLIFQFDLFN